MSKLAQIVALVESDNNPRAIRYEPNFDRMLDGKPLDRVIPRIMRVHECNRVTAEMLASASWGKYQILGYNIYMMYPDATMRVWEYLSFPDAQDAAFQKFVEARQINFSDDELTLANLLRFATIYNGPANPVVYSERLAKRLSELKS